MLGVPPQVRSPIPAIMRLLSEELQGRGCAVRLHPWGAHADHESLFRKVFGRVADIMAVRRLLRTDPPDVVVVHTAHGWYSLLRDLGLALACRGVARRLVYEYHGSSSQDLLGGARPLFRAVTRTIVRRADAIFLLSNAERADWTAAIPEGRYFVVRNPVETIERGSRDTAAVPAVLFAGRLIPEKGSLDLVRAAALLPRELPWHVVIAGDGPIRAELEAAVRDSGLVERVRVAGHLGRDALVRAYREAAVFALPTYWNEGLPIVILDAMQCGLPIVTTEIRAMRDYLVDGVNAVFVPARDPEALAAALRRLLTDVTLRERMGARNLEESQAFRPARVAADYFACLEEIVAEGGATVPVTT